jgi:hypothetical protein
MNAIASSGEAAYGRATRQSRSKRPAVLMLALGLLTASMIALTPGVAAAATGTLGPGAVLTAGQELTSPDGHYDLVMQSDGNLVVYIAGGRALWSSKTEGNPGDYAVMQTNGNFVIYSSSNQTLWSTNTTGAGCSDFVMQDDGNLVLYNSAGKAAWASGTLNSVLEPSDKLTAGEELYSNSRQYDLIMQADGNLVLYDSAGKALWSSKTDGDQGDYLIMQPDGNLVIYSSAGKALWSSKTDGKTGDHLIVQNDGNVVIYVGTTAVWDTGTEHATRQTAQAARAAATPVPNCGVPVTPPPTTPTPTPTPAPAPAPVVVYVPVLVYVPAPSAPHHVKVRLTMSWTWNREHTRLYRVTGTRIPKHAAITVSCHGRGCPHKAQVASVHIKRLLKSLAGDRYKAGDRIFITIRSPGEVAERIELWIRDGKEPRVKLLR